MRSRCLLTPVVAAPLLGGWSLLMLGTLALLLAPQAMAQSKFITFESGHVRPLTLSPDGSRLFAVNTPDNTLEIFDVDGSGTLSWAGSTPVGMEPVAVAARSNSEVWVVNFLSDSVSIVDLSGSQPRVVRTLHTGDEPSDLVFAGPGGNRAFVTTAHRGQNTPNVDGDYDQEGIGRADIWVFDATNLGASMGGNEIAIVTVFGDKPRALAVSGDGSKVYAAVFHSGNNTTAINDNFVCDTSNGNLNSDTVQGSCSVGGQTSPGGSPTPHQNQQDIDRPETGLIVKWQRDGVTNQWHDELGRNWNDFVNFDLPDRDVFEINANANPPVAVDGSSSCSNGSGCWAGVGTILFNMAVNPISGKIYVSNTDAQNHVRFEGPGTVIGGPKAGSYADAPSVIGNLAQSRITVLDGSSVTPRHLNKHIDYDVLPAPGNVKQDSLATPTGMVVTPDGSTLYVAAFGSAKVGVFDTTDLEDNSFTPSSSDHILLSGGGASGLALAGNRLYVMTRFNNSISVVDTVSKNELQTLTLHNPEPPSVVEGRPFLYDSVLTSSNGEASCSSCHIFGDLDDLAWDLGNPDDNQVAINNPMNDEAFSGTGFNSCQLQNLFTGTGCQFHPMKGPMTTQSLRGMANMGPQHWRGDRQVTGPLTPEENAFNAFNVAFAGLVGRPSQLSPGDMQKFTDFALQIRYPPNPIRNLDRSLTGQQSQGETIFNDPNTDQVASCEDCHTLSAANGDFGADSRSTFDAGTQIVKVPHLRNMYQKVGMFGEPQPDAVSTPIGNVTVFEGPFNHTGDQVRGFGFTHDGSVDTLDRFVSASLFTINTNANDRARVEAFMIAFDTDLAPIVGQQVTLNSSNGGTLDARIDLMIARCSTNFQSKVLVDLNGGPVNDCDLIAKLNDAGAQSGYLYDPVALLFMPDTGGAGITDAALRTKAGSGGQEVTYTAVPPGSGHRMGLDRDGDTLLNGVETGTGVFVNASDTGTRADLDDTDGDGWDDPTEVAAGSDPNDPLDFPGAAAVPALGGWATALLIALLVVSAWYASTSRESGRRPRTA